MATLLVATTGGHLAQLVDIANRLPDDGDDIRVWVTHDNSQSRSALAGERTRRVALEAEVGWQRGALTRQNAVVEALRGTVATLTRQQVAVGERLTAVMAHGATLQREVGRLRDENATLQATNARLRAALVVGRDGEAE